MKFKALLLVALSWVISSSAVAQKTVRIATGETVLMCSASNIASAYDVKVDNFYYNIIDDSYLEVTAPEDYDINFWPYFDAPALNVQHKINDYAGDLVIPESVRIEGHDSPLPVRAIGRCAFYNAQNLKSVTLPATIEQISEGAFANCGISKLDMGANDRIDKIPNWMCYECAGLSDIVLPSHIQSIGDGAFMCTAICELSFPDGLIYIGEQAFFGSALQKISFNGPKTRVRAYAFADNPLQEITGWECLTELEHMVFRNTKLKEIVLGSQLSRISFGTFNALKNLKQVICYIDDPYEFQNDTDLSCDDLFGESTQDGVILWVPDQSLETYRNSTFWTSFFTDIRPLSQVGISCVKAVNPGAAKLFDMNGREVSDPRPGRIYITSDGSKLRF